MAMPSTRRRFLQTTAAGSAMLGLGDLTFLSQLPRVSAQEASSTRKIVQNPAEIEPLVRLLETTSRDRLLETVAAKIKAGTSYQEILAALMLAAVRNVEPRPAVGFKFHAVLVVNSAHVASLASPESERWLPIFWALDYFKRNQLEEERRNGWKMAPVDESAVPPAHKARAAFVEAMEKWDEQAADAAIASLVRTSGANEVYELLYHYGGRDFRSIGHKAIFVANSQRTLATIGWRYAEPVLRSLVYAILNHRNEPNPADSDLDADRPFRRNQELAEKIRSDWPSGKLSNEATRELLSVFHSGSNDEACDLAVEQLNHGVAPQSIWDAVLVGAGELLMRQPGIVGLHGLTTANALYHAAQTSGNDQTRRLTLLQNCAFQPMFREELHRRQRRSIKELSLDDLKPIQPSESSETGAIEEIFADLSRNKLTAAAKTRAYLSESGSAKSLIDAARRLIFLKGTNTHDYKFSSAVLEDYYHVSPQWRDVFLAMNIVQLRGSGQKDNSLVERTRAALS